MRIKRKKEHTTFSTRLSIATPVAIGYDRANANSSSMICLALEGERGNKVVVETIQDREITSLAVLREVEMQSTKGVFAEDIARALKESNIDSGDTLRTIWRLIDENRLFLDGAGHLVLEKS